MRATSMPSSKLLLMAAIAGCAALQGCTILAIADTVGTVAVRTVGVAANVAVSTAATAAEVSIATTKIGVKVVGAAVDAAIPAK
jgi:uncharacterized protein YunC (DUF1805 family)